MATGKTIALTRRTFVGKVMSLLLNMLSRLVITFLPRSERLLISWLQSPSVVILEPRKVKSDIVSTLSLHDALPILQVRKQQLELDMEQWTVSKLGKEYIKAVYCHPAYLTSIQSTSCEMPGWMKHKLESRLLGETWITTDTQITPSLWQKAKKN